MLILFFLLGYMHFYRVFELIIVWNFFCMLRLEVEMELGQNLKLEMRVFDE